MWVSGRRLNLPRKDVESLCTLNIEPEVRFYFRLKQLIDKLYELYSCSRLLLGHTMLGAHLFPKCSLDTFYILVRCVDNSWNIIRQLSSQIISAGIGSHFH